MSDKTIPEQIDEVRRGVNILLIAMGFLIAMVGVLVWRR